VEVAIIRGRLSRAGSIFDPDWQSTLHASTLRLPSMHKVHHSVVCSECDSNYSSLFSWWDRLCRANRVSPEPHRIIFGLEE